MSNVTKNEFPPYCHSFCRWGARWGRRQGFGLRCRAPTPSAISDRQTHVAPELSGVPLPGGVQGKGCDERYWEQQWDWAGQLCTMGRMEQLEIASFHCSQCSHPLCTTRSAMPSCSQPGIPSIRGERMPLNHVPQQEALLALPTVRAGLRDAGWGNTQPGSLIDSGHWLTVTARGFSGYSLLIEMTVEEQTLLLLRHLFWAKGNLSFIVSSSKWDDISSVGGQMYWKPVKIHSIFRDADMLELGTLL